MRIDRTRPWCWLLVGLVGCGARTSLSFATGPSVDAGPGIDAASGLDAAVAEEASVHPDASSPVDAGCVPAPSGGIVIPIGGLDASDTINAAVGVTAGSLYFGTTSIGSGALYTGAVFTLPLPAAPGAASTFAAPDYNYGQLVADDAYVYYLQTMGQATGGESAIYMTTAIGAIARDGTVSATPSLVVAPDSTSSLSNAWMIAASPSVSGVFWAGSGGEGSGAGIIEHWAVGDAITQVAAGESIEGISVREGFLYWVDNVTASGVTVFRAPASGGAPVMLANVAGGMNGSLLGVSAGGIVFVGDLATAAIYVVSLDGGTPTLLVNAAAPWVNAIGWVDDEALYWTENENQSVLERVALTGGAPTVVPTEGQVQDVAFDACNVYVASTGPTEVLVLPQVGE